MSDLHVGLLILGFLIVGYVVIYNWWQDRKLQKRANQVFSKPKYDSLLEPEQTELFNNDYKELETQILEEGPLHEIKDNKSYDLKKETTYEPTSDVNFSDLDTNQDITGILLGDVNGTI